jgi:hypothetical protein
LYPIITTKAIMITATNNSKGAAAWPRSLKTRACPRFEIAINLVLELEALLFFECFIKIIKPKIT